MASASSRITSLKPFLGKWKVPSEDFFNLTSISGPKPTCTFVPSGPASDSPFLLDLWMKQTSVVTQRTCPSFSTLKGTEVWLPYFCYVTSGPSAFLLCTLGILLLNVWCCIFHHLRPSLMPAFHLFLCLPPSLLSIPISIHFCLNSN